jgi:hypothetical protein
MISIIQTRGKEKPNSAKPNGKTKAEKKEARAAQTVERAGRA